MGDSDSADTAPTSGWRSGNVWARPDVFGSNPVRQLLVPAGVVHAIVGENGALEVRNNHGAWPASPVDLPMDNGLLWVRLPLGARPGGTLTTASWHLPSPLSRSAPGEVLDSYRDAITFVEGSQGNPGLRSPQLGAVHSVMGYWTTKSTVPATVVMPTGTGKTETMLALLVAARPLQVAGPGAVGCAARAGCREVRNPGGTPGARHCEQTVRCARSSGRLMHGLADVDTASAFAEACNVIVATPQSLGACTAEARAALFGACSHLFVDEAHHVAASTWSAIRRGIRREAGRAVHRNAVPRGRAASARTDRLLVPAAGGAVPGLFLVDRLHLGDRLYQMWTDRWLRRVSRSCAATSARATTTS